MMKSQSIWRAYRYGWGDSCLLPHYFGWALGYLAGLHTCKSSGRRRYWLST